MNLVIIGYGGMGVYHAERLKNFKGITVTGAYDTDPLRLKAASDDGYKAYQSAQEIFADEKVDGILIATPNDFHLQYTLAAAKAKKAVLCEKPATLSTAEFDEMTAACEKAKVLFQVHQNRRYDADYLMVRDIIESGVIGRLERIESNVMGANGIPGGWRKLKAQGGGMVLDWGVHLIDQLTLLMKAPIDKLYSSLSFNQGFDVDDGFSLEMICGNVSYNCRVDTNAFISLPRWVLYGKDGTAVIKDWELNGEIVTAVYGADSGAGMQAGNGFTKTMAYRPHTSVNRLPLPPARSDADAFYRGFAASFSRNAPPLVRSQEVRRVLEIMELALKGGFYTDIKL